MSSYGPARGDSTKFDPYYEWLGIRPEEHPISLYRLLGIADFEDNPNVIDRAADRQMGHLRTFQVGEHGSLSQQLLNEVARARSCLLNPQGKFEYDQRLRHQRAAVLPPFPQPMPMMHAPPPQMPAPIVHSPAPMPQALVPAAPRPATLPPQVSIKTHLPAPEGRRKPSGSQIQLRLKDVRREHLWLAGLACTFIVILLAGAIIAARRRNPAPLPSRAQADAIAAKQPVEEEPQKKPSLESQLEMQVAEFPPSAQEVAAAADEALATATIAAAESNPQPEGNPQLEGSPLTPAASPPPESNDDKPSNEPTALEAAQTPAPSEPTFVRVLDIEPTSAEVGWGGFETSKNWDWTRNTQPLVAEVPRYAAESIYAHAPSKLVFKLPRGQKSFSAVGYCPSSRHVKFRVSNQNMVLAESEITGHHAFKIDLPDRTVELHLEVDDAGDRSRDQAFWCYPRFHQARASEIEQFDARDRCVLLTKLTPLSVSVGDGTVLINQAVRDELRPLHPDSIVQCEDFLFAHADSRLRYQIPENAREFSAIGYCMLSQHVKFRVYVDRRMVAESAQAGIVEMKVDLPSGAKLLTLEVDTLGDGNSDHSFWCYPRFRLQ